MYSNIKGNFAICLSSDLTNCWLSGKSLEDWLEKVSAGGCKKYWECCKRIRFCWKLSDKYKKLVFRWISRKSWRQIGKKHGKQVLPICPKNIPAQTCCLKKVFSSPPSRPRIGLQWGQRTVGSRRSLWNNCHVKRWTWDRIGGQKLLAFSCVLKCWTFVFITRTLVYTGWHRRTVESGSLTFLPFSFKYWDNT